MRHGPFRLPPAQRVGAALDAQDGFGGGPSVADKININLDGFDQLLDGVSRSVFRSALVASAAEV